MKDRRTVYWLAALALAAALSQLLVWWLRPPAKPPVMTGPPRSSYELDEFTLRAFGADGKLAFAMTAPHLARREGNASLYINAPKYFFAIEGPDWHGTSEYAWVSADNRIVKLIGKVDLYRPPGESTPAAEIHTADATVWTQDKRMASAALSVIQQPGRILRGTGMQADFNTHSLELLSNVHDTFDPPIPDPP